MIVIRQKKTMNVRILRIFLEKVLLNARFFDIITIRAIVCPG